jgi:protein-tyrosine phosphatase
METIRPWLYLGRYRDTINHTLLTSYRVGAMVQLAEHAPHPQIPSLYLPVEDGVPLPGDVLRQGVAFARAAQQQEQKVLIACGAGISRSATFVIATLKEVEHLSLLEAIRDVRQRHPSALPHPALWESLCRYYNEAMPFLTMMRLLHEPHARDVDQK